MSGHTMGPWAVSKNSSGRRVTTTKGVVICNAVLRNTGRADRGVNFGAKEHKEAEANARLIAAAPDLLAIVERLVTIYDGMEDGNGDPCPAIDAAKRLIARATSPESPAR